MDIEFDSISKGKRNSNTDASACSRKVEFWLAISAPPFPFLPFSPFSVSSENSTDATNDFEDVSHSDAAREMMDKYYIRDIDVSTVPLKRAYIPPQQALFNLDKTSEFVIKIL
ncbi:cytochrome b5-like [Lycium ferocissimum]|uniref:cytochrome b5-like n=1 Tax=Lycium ferocissimum TaxID=112874 RepID=UPI0028163F40|nr:cytochrome b5-like [Lycium ferocissimum]